jgi:hypothetical protein
MPKRKSNQKLSVTRRRRRDSVMGKILPPAEINSVHDFNDMNERFKIGPVTLVFISADWCGHCQEFKKNWEEAVKSPNRSIQAVKLNEKVLSEANSFIQSNINSNAKPFEPEGFPSVIVVDKKGNTLTEIEPRKDTAYLTEMMSQAGPLAVEAGLSQNETKKPEGESNSPSMLGNKVTLKNNDLPLPHSLSASLPNPSKNSNNTSLTISDKESKLLSSLYSIPQNVNQLAQPPRKEEDREEEGMVVGGYTSTGGLSSTGGSLYQALSPAAYTLAPTAVLLATASQVIPRKRRFSKKTKKSNRRFSKKTKKSNRRSKPTRRSKSRS